MSKRMFSADIVESDAFLDMPLTAQALYMHLNMNADHDGFVNPKRILRMVGGNDDDLRILIAKRFVLVFPSGVIVIKHWWINNTKRLDRHMPTTYQAELAELDLKPNKSYTEKAPQLALETSVGNQVATGRQPDGNQMAPEAMFNRSYVHSSSSNDSAETAENKKSTQRTKAAFTAIATRLGSTAKPEDNRYILQVIAEILKYHEVAELIAAVDEMKRDPWILANRKLPSAKLDYLFFTQTKNTNVEKKLANSIERVSRYITRARERPAQPDDVAPDGRRIVRRSFGGNNE